MMSSAIASEVASTLHEVGVAAVAIKPFAAIVGCRCQQEHFDSEYRHDHELAHALPTAALATQSILLV
ncbi:MAG: hypothetical protein KatS3mg067_0167 [Thermosynechococcus sp.]|nr:MAG: hypothetical protein KatS3mg067_0167 [Thermosynechococcus sp.]